MKRFLLVTLLAWSQLVMGQSEPITSLKGQSSATKFTAPQISVPYNQATKIGGGKGLIETGNGNMLANPDMEAPTVSGWTCTVGTCTVTTASGEYTSGKQALKVVLSAQSMNISQTITTPSGIMEQGYARFTYRIPSAIVTPTLTITVDSVLQITVPTSRLIADDKFHQIDVPFVFGSTDVKVSYLSGSSTGNVFIDLTGVYQGLNGTSGIELDNTYSARVDGSTGAVTRENKEWITGSCSVATNIYTCPVTPFTVLPNCTVTMDGLDRNILGIASGSTNSSIIITSLDSNTGGADPNSFIINCQKSAPDYQTSEIYSQASANTLGLPYTATLTGHGTTTAANLRYEYIGNKIRIFGNYNMGSAGGGGTGSLTLPTGVIADASQYAAASTSGPCPRVGWLMEDGSYNVPILLCSTTSTTILYTGARFAGTSTAATAHTPEDTGNWAASSAYITIDITIPVQGRAVENIHGVFTDMIPRIAYVSDVKASNIAGGNPSAGSYLTRDLNTLTDPDAIVSGLSSNAFTLPAGTYELNCRIPGYASNTHKARLRNITDSTTDLLGSSSYATSAGGAAQTDSIISGRLLLTASKAFEVQHYLSNGATNGFGQPVNTGDSEVYTKCKIQKLK